MGASHPGCRQFREAHSAHGEGGEPLRASRRPIEGATNDELNHALSETGRKRLVYEPLWFENLK